MAVRVQEWCAGVPRATEGGVRSPSLRSLTESSCGISLPSTALVSAAYVTGSSWCACQTRSKS